ncbi:MAG: hypothetical protein WCB91_03830, partial [Halobacteriota archaeon]
GKTSISASSEQAISTAAGVWMLRGGSGNHWSRRVMSWKTMKQVQKCTAKVRTHPTVELSIPEDTKEDYDPPLEDVTFSVSVSCPPRLEQFIIPYIITTEKARSGWGVDERAVVTFGWSGSAKKKFTKPDRSRWTVTRTLLQVSVDASESDKDELRFFVGGEDVREWMSADRAMLRNLRETLPPFFKRLRLLMRHFRDRDPQFIGVLRSVMGELRDGDPQFYEKLRKFLVAIRKNETDPRFYEKLRGLMDTLNQSDPQFYGNLRRLVDTISTWDPQFYGKLTTPIPTHIRRSLAADPIHIRDEDDTFEKTYKRYKGIKDEEGRDKKAPKRHKGRGLRKPPEVPWAEFWTRLAIAYDKELRNRRL